MGDYQVTIVNNRASFRIAVLEAVRANAEQLMQPLEEGTVVGPDLAAIPIIGRGVLAEVLARVKASDLPPIDPQSAEVKTPADIYVDAICPNCGMATRILATLEAALEVTREGRTVKLKAKAKAKTHVCGQASLELDEADGQESLGLDQGEDVDVEDEGLAPDEDSEDIRPAGDVNVDELKGDVERSIEPDDDLLPD